jgi:phosphohistidine phosphatase
MNIYLAQHAEAQPEEVNPERPLTEQGRQNAESVASIAGKLELEIDQIRHSGKTRAEQTAKIMGEALSPQSGVVAASGLGPVDDVKPVAGELTTSSQPIMLVGHLPFMERLTGQMVVGDADQLVVKFRNAAIVCLSRDDEAWQIVRDSG